MFETDRLAPDHVHRCNAMDEIWVPTESVRQVFAISGVAEDKCVSPDSHAVLRQGGLKLSLYPLNDGIFNTFVF